MMIPVLGSDYSRAGICVASNNKGSYSFAQTSTQDARNPVAAQSFLTALNDFRFMCG
jgi:hypothetical protein